jgi:hypothetical protein
MDLHFLLKATAMLISLNEVVRFSEDGGDHPSFYDSFMILLSIECDLEAKDQ